MPSTFDNEGEFSYGEQEYIKPKQLEMVRS